MGINTEPNIIRITDESPRCDIEQAIVALRAKLGRMPNADRWEDRRAELRDEIDDLVQQWLKAPA